MGPRAWDRGERMKMLQSCSTNSRLQWSRGLGTAESSDSSSLNRASNVLQWGRGLGTAERMTTAAETPPPKLASMGPRSWDRGELTAARNTPEATGPLQWGRGLGTAESARPPGFPRKPPLLQWGRGLGTAESAEACCIVWLYFCR